MQPEELRQVVCENIRLRRRELGLTQVSVAKTAKITQCSLSRIEAGLEDPTTDKLARLSLALKTSPSALLSPKVFSASA